MRFRTFVPTWLKTTIRAASVGLLFAAPIAVHAQAPAIRPTAFKSDTPAHVCRDCQHAIESGLQCRECALKMANKMMVEPNMMSGSFVYTLDNDERSNGVAVYRRAADGSLRPLSGSPFAAGGKGLSGGDIDEQGAIRVHGEFVLAVNPGSDSIAVLKKSNAGLLHVEGSPFASGGNTPLSLAVHGDLVYVANQAATFAKPSNEPCLTGFRLSSSGQLTPLPGSRVKFPVGQGPAEIEFSPDGKTLAATAGFQADEGSRLYAYRVQADGRLQMAPGSPLKPEGATGTVGFSWGHRGDRIYVSAFKGSAVIAIAVDASTSAIHQAGIPVGDDQRAACWTAMAHGGKTLYVGNFVSNSVSVFDVMADGSLTLLGSVPRRGATEKDTKDIELSPDGKYLYAIGSGARQISVFRVETNRLLTELPPGQSPLTIPTGQNTTGLVID